VRIAITRTTTSALDLLEIQKRIVVPARRIDKEGGCCLVKTPGYVRVCVFTHPASLTFTFDPDGSDPW
jgi:hypothetical protein